MTLLHFQLRGHQPIALIGGATGFIGDPSGRSSERTLLDTEEFQQNVNAITRQVTTFFTKAKAYAIRHNVYPETGLEPKFVNNLDWFENVRLLDFLRSTGKQTRVNVMLTRDSVSSRLQDAKGLSFTEFSYQLLQAHDFYHLNKEYNCRVQIGGSDQWGNIVSGIDLIRRNKNKVKGEPSPWMDTADQSELATPGDTHDAVYGLTIPLLTTPSGEKFGKSAGNAVWLDQKRTSVYDFYQYFIRVSDEMVGTLLQAFTLLPSEAITAVMQQHSVDPSKRHAQRTLAAEVTELVHGPDSVQHAEAATKALFGTNLEDINVQDVIDALEGDPRLVQLPREVALDKRLTKLTAENGLTNSVREAQTAMSAGGFYLNGEKIKDVKRRLVEEDLLGGRVAILRVGATDHLVVLVTSTFTQPVESNQ